MTTKPETSSPEAAISSPEAATTASSLAVLDSLPEVPSSAANGSHPVPSWPDRIGDWIETASGRRAFPLDPRPSDIWLPDIVHALSHICRFGGHSREYLSVAEHSVRVALIADWLMKQDPTLAGRYFSAVCRAALLHDTGEAYTYDFPRPVKGAMFVEVVIPAIQHSPSPANPTTLFHIREIEHLNRAAILYALPIEERFGMQYFAHRAVRQADELALHSEARACMRYDWSHKLSDVLLDEVVQVAPVQFLGPREARHAFKEHASRIGLGAFNMQDEGSEERGGDQHE